MGGRPLTPFPVHWRSWGWSFSSFFGGWGGGGGGAGAVDWLSTRLVLPRTGKARQCGEAGKNEAIE